MAFSMRNSTAPYAFRDTVQRQQNSLWSDVDPDETKRPIVLPTIQFANDVDDPASNVSDFVKRLYRMLEDKMYPSIVAWSQTGDSFVIKDITDFTKTILPRLFKHSNFASFVRQLNKYSFHKVKSPNMNDPAVGDQSWVFRHDHFQSKNIAGLEHIKRKVPAPRKIGSAPNGQHENGKSSSQQPDLAGTRAASPQDRVDTLTRAHAELNASVRQLDTGYQALLSEVVALQRTMTQQASVIQQMVQQVVATGSGDFARIQAQLDNADFWSLPVPSTTLAGCSTEPSLSGSANNSPMLSPTLGLNGDLSLENIFNSPTDIQLSPESRTQAESTPDVQLPDILGLFPPASTVFPISPSKQPTLSTAGETVSSESLGQANPSSSSKLARSTPHVPHWAVPPRVLLVDDDSVCVLLSSKFLKTLGCSIDVAIDGLSAVDKMNTSKYDLVLMDISMPNLDGVSATTIIRQFDILTPIISMTGSASPSDVLNYYSHGMTDVLSKPFTREKLVNILEKHLNHLTTIVLPRNPGIPPLADASFSDAVSAGLIASPSEFESRSPNPLAGMGVSDELYASMVRELLSSMNGRKHSQDSSESVPPAKRSRFEVVQ